MPSRMRHVLLISMTMIALVFASVIISYAETVNYIYDELNRLIRVEYGDGTKIAYTYDGVGNRSQVYVGKYTLAVNVVGSGTVTKNPDQPIYNPGTSVTLTAVNGSQTFSEWSGDLTGSTNPTNIVMDGNKSVTATFVTPQGWLQGWTYRKAVTLSRASGAVTNYQMRLLVGETSGASGENVDCNGHVQADFDDLRFATSDGATLLDYWIESITGTTPNQLATVWIEFDSIGTDATTFYMYYGNSGASAYSNGNNTFVLFDDFPGSSLDGTKWNSSGTVTVSGGTVITSGNANQNRWYSKSTYNGNYAVYFRLKSTGQYGRCGFQETPGNLLNNGDVSDHIGIQNNAGTGLYTNFRNTSNSQADDGNTNNSFHIFEMLWLPGTSAQIKYDGTSLRTVTGSQYIPNEGVYVKGADYLTVDYVFLRNYVSSEPTWGSWGTEQAN